MHIVWPGVSLAGIGLVVWILWSWVSGSGITWLGASAEEWAEMLKTVWTAILVVAPAGSVALGSINVLRGKQFLTGTDPVST